MDVSRIQCSASPQARASTTPPWRRPLAATLDIGHSCKVILQDIHACSASHLRRRPDTNLIHGSEEAPISTAVQPNNRPRRSKNTPASAAAKTAVQPPPSPAHGSQASHLLPGTLVSYCIHPRLVLLTCSTGLTTTWSYTLTM